MRSLFAKIFLSFFLTVVLLGVLLEITAVRSEMRRVQEVIRPLVETASVLIAAAYEARGPEGVTAETRHQLLSTALLDDRDQPIGQVPGDLASPIQALREVLGRGSERPTTFTVWQSVALQPVRGPSGRQYMLVVRLPHERWTAILNTLDQFPVLRLTIVGLVAALACFLLARHITRPLVRLRATAGRMAEGRLEARAGASFASRRDEIGALGRDFDVMADRLTQLVSSQRQLMADVSHELRSPLARLTVALGLARRHVTEPTSDGSTTSLAADLDRIELEAGRIDRLVGQSLTLARIGSGVDAGSPETFDLTNLVEQIAADADYEARASNRRVDVIRSEACAMVGVQELVRSAIENVVRNAVRHTGTGTTVDIDLRRSDDDGTASAYLHVRDRGPGIADGLLGEIFLPFRRPGASANRRNAGAGLGLAIADRVVRMHGGRISATNAATGGLDVELRWPIEAGQ